MLMMMCTFEKIDFDLFITTTTQSRLHSHRVGVVVCGWSIYKMLNV